MAALDRIADCHHACVYPVLRFVVNGRSLQVRGAAAQYVAAGDRVTVVYDPRDPQEADIDSAWHLCFWPVVLECAVHLVSGRGRGRLAASAAAVP